MALKHNFKLTQKVEKQSLEKQKSSYDNLLTPYPSGSQSLLRGPRL
jgi:hypothetical protein